MVTPGVSRCYCYSNWRVADKKKEEGNKSCAFADMAIKCICGVPCCNSADVSQLAKITFSSDKTRERVDSSEIGKMYGGRR